MKDQTLSNPAASLSSASTSQAARDVELLLSRFGSVREFTELLCEPLAPEDMVVQTMTEVSPTKWHLAHTTWFYENFILRAAIPDYADSEPEYAYLFNSYYQAAGPMHCRARRGLISRPTVDEILDYRREVDRRVVEFFSRCSASDTEEWAKILVTGLHHEQQHQELMLTDIKHVFAQNPLFPAYGGRKEAHNSTVPPLGWKYFEEGICEIGHSGQDFHYDNERPRHRRFLESFLLADRLVTTGEYLAFMEDGGYSRPEFWLSLGWMQVQENEWKAPLYWHKLNGDWYQYTLAGLRPIEPAEPVTHLSFFEASAYARWAGCRLPEEAEWEWAASRQTVEGHFVEAAEFHPRSLTSNEGGDGPARLFGDVWEWTRSSYAPYPGYEAAFGALGEYNGKFMCNQYVLRGGSCVTSQSHIRPTYRNFFPPDKRWQFTGIRLAKDPR